MVDVVEPGRETRLSSMLTAAAIGAAGGTGIGGNRGWIVPEDEDYLATWHESLRNGPLGGFKAEEIEGRLVRVSSGEAFLGGRYVARDESTNVTVLADRDNTGVFLGLDRGTDRIRIGNAQDLSGFRDWLVLAGVDTDAHSILDLRDIRRTSPQLIGSTAELGGGGGGDTIVEGGEIGVRDSGSNIGEFETLDFGDNLSVTDLNGTARIDADVPEGDGGGGDPADPDLLTPNVHLEVRNMPANTTDVSFRQHGVKVPSGFEFRLHTIGIEEENTFDTSNIRAFIHRDVGGGQPIGTIEYELSGEAGASLNDLIDMQASPPLATISGPSQVYLALQFTGSSGTPYAGAFFAYRLVES